MANRKNTTAAQTELPAEIRARKLRARADELRAKIELQGMQAAQKEIKSALANYQAAGRGRQNRDWRASPGSADLMIVPDAPLLNARARQTVRDSWIGASMIRAAKRNVSGTGIKVVPAAKAADGSLLRNFNKRVRGDFDRWGKDKRYCDLEKRQNFYQKQRLAVAERYTVGQHFIVWSYVPNLNVRGEIDFRMPVGLKLQSFEPEQLDYTIQSYMGREVRGGIEIDTNTNEAVAYHFYTKNPNDYLSRTRLCSVRIEAARVLHYFDQERVLQTQGATQLAPVLQEIRDFNRFKEATLWRTIMEACIGLIVKKNATTQNGFSPLGVNRATGDTGQTSTGMNTIDMVPGMTPHLAEGEDVVPYTPSSPGNGYEPFTTTTLRGIGAGVGMSGDAITRHADGNYSAARQNMLEDWREWEPEQDNLISDIILPVYTLFFCLSVLEGRFDDEAEFDAGDFAEDPDRFTDAACIAPARPWIDPEKEANAFKVLIDKRLITREEIITGLGGRFSETVHSIGQETKEAGGEGVVFPEVAENVDTLADANQKNADAESKLRPPVAVGGPDPALEKTKAEFDAYGVAVRGGTITPQSEDEAVARQRLGLPPMSADAIAAWAKDGNVRRPITLAPTPGTATPAFGAASPPVDNTDTANDSNLSRRVALVQADAPNYRPAPVAEVACATCRYLVDGKCQAYDFPASPSYVCDAFETQPVSDATGHNIIGTPPLNGEPSIDNTAASGFTPDARLS
jgi:lambda family phage portal protein